MISAIAVALLALALSAGVEKLTGYDILGSLYVSDKSEFEPSRVYNTYPKASDPPHGAGTPRMKALLRERKHYGMSVSRVVDGDTLEILDRGGEKIIKVRLYGSDAPETKKPEHGGQPFGEEAFAALRNKAEGENVDVEVVDIDSYDRAIAIVRRNGRDINMEMVSEGLAECYLEYLEGPYKRECLLAEAKAKQIKKGIWALKDYERPSEFRRRMRQ